MRRAVFMLACLCIWLPLAAGAETAPCPAQVRLLDGREVKLHDIGQMVGWQEFARLAATLHESDELVELTNLASFQRATPATSPAKPGLIAFAFAARDGAKGVFWLQEGTEIVGQGELGYWRGQVADLESVRLNCP